MSRNPVAWVVFGLALSATPASASEHMMVVNEVMRSTGGDPTAQLIELWDTGNEPFPAASYFVDIFDADGALVGRVAAPGLSGGNGPQYYVLSTAAADAKLGITGDAPLTIALPAAGQACFIGTSDRKVHCVAWGCVNTKVTPATPLGASPGDGASLQRTPSGANLTVAAPTPRAANAMGTMDDPCPVGPSPDAGTDGGGDDGDGGCCDSGNGDSSIILAGSLLLLATTRRRRGL